MAEVLPDIAVYKILTLPQWEALQASGTYELSGVDAEDGYVHFSRKGQVARTLALHFGAHERVMLLEVETAPLIDFMKWEEARGGELFPHLYGAFTMEEVRRHWPLERGAKGWGLPEEFPQDVV